MRRAVLVLPAYNNESSLELAFDRIFRALDMLKGTLDVDILVEDDKSADGTSQALSELMEKIDITVVSNPVNVGPWRNTKNLLNYALQTSPDFVLKTDLDRDHGQQDVIKRLAVHLLDGQSVVCGYRRIGKEEGILDYLFQNEIGKEIGRRTRLEFAPGTSGSQGFTGYALSAIMSHPYVKAYQRRWGVDIILPIIAQQLGFPMRFIEVSGEYESSRRTTERTLERYPTYWRALNELTHSS